MRYISILILLFSPVLVAAQSPVQPMVTIEAPSEAVTVGQPAIVRIKVLVPTYMPSPPVFPSLEQENMLVRLPERASGPVSETVNGETWSGVQRSYRVYPLQAGPFDFNNQSVGVTFADPDTNAPVQATVPLPSVALNATIPDGAKGLDPIIIATDFKVDQFLDGAPDVASGGAVTRRLTATITGTTPLLIPQLIPTSQDQLLRAYPKEPKITETEDRGILSGQRIDEVVYLAQNGGRTQLPAISISWFNLDSGNVETFEIPQIDLNLAAPPKEPMSTEDVLKATLWIAAFILFGWALWRIFYPRYRTWKQGRDQRYLASAQFALDELEHALRAQDLAGAYTALEKLKTRSKSSKSRDLEDCLIRIGAARYARGKSPTAEDWDAARAAFKSLRHRQRKNSFALPPLNPRTQL